MNEELQTYLQGPEPVEGHGYPSFQRRALDEVLRLAASAVEPIEAKIESDYETARRRSQEQFERDKQRIESEFQTRRQEIQSRRDDQLEEIKVGAGIGLRYLSPIGPLRLEVGWKLDREVGEGSSVVFLSFGNPF